uniref:Uncharacterized protein n=1 Tax=viral metagenome TaxID=1070528 RepID=A0A6C0K023_9ZZZZ
MATKLYLLGLYNQCTEIIKKSCEASALLLNATCNYLNGTSNEWYFLSTDLVIPASAYTARTSNQKARIQWTYNSYRNTLVETLESPEPVALKLDWLSTILHFDNREYVLDAWIQNLYIVMDDVDPSLTPERLVQAWAIAHKLWPEDATLHIIDSDGDSHTISVFEDTNSDEWQALLPRQTARAEPYVHSESESDEEHLECTCRPAIDPPDCTCIAECDAPDCTCIAECDAPEYVESDTEVPAIEAPAIEAPATPASPDQTTGSTDQSNESN